MNQRLGLLLKEARKKKELTQVEACEGLQMNYRHFQNIEAGKIDLRLSTLGKLMNFFDVELEEICKVITNKE